MLYKMGSRGSGVSDLQKRLNAAGFSAGAVDGIFGRNTRSAVRKFQKARGLVVDGLAGKNTLGALNGGRKKLNLAKKLQKATSPSATITKAKKGTPSSASAGSAAAPALPGLTAQQVSELSARRRSATRSFQEALAQQQNQTNLWNSERSRALSGLEREYDSARETGRASYADVGLARNPRQTGRLFRQLRDEETVGRSELMEQDAVQRAALQQWVDQVRRARDEEIAAIEADTVRLKSDPSRLYQGIQF